MKKEKFMKYAMIVVMLFMSLSLFSETVAEPPSNYNTEGAGTKDNPFLISNLANLRWLSENREYWGSVEQLYHFLQVSDIEAYETRNWNNGAGFNPIGLRTYELVYFPESNGLSGGYRPVDLKIVPFFGIYDGNNHIISNLFILYDDQEIHRMIGLFGRIDQSILKNIVLQNVSITNLSDAQAGALVGSVTNNSLILNCSSSGIVKAINNAGGLIGTMLNSSVIDSKSSGFVSGIGRAVGGLIGKMTTSTVERNSFNGIVDGQERTGGLIGYSDGFTQGATIRYSSSHGYVISKSSTRFTGGLVGSASLTNIESCYSTTNIVVENVSEHARVGGLAGSHSGIGTIFDVPIMKNSFFYGNIIFQDEPSVSVGGLAGSVSTGIIQHSYVASRTGIVNQYGESGSIRMKGSLIGFLWYRHSGISNSFWDIDTVMLDQAVGQVQDNPSITDVYGFTTPEMKQASTYQKHGWDFDTIWEIDPNINDGYPFIRAIPPPTMDFRDLLIPQNLIGEVNNDQITLTWSPPSILVDGGFSDGRGAIIAMPPEFALFGYNVYRDGVLIATLDNVLTYTDTGVSNGYSYSYRITAVFGVIESDLSNNALVALQVSEDDEVVDLMLTGLLGNFPNPFNPSTNIRFEVGGSRFENPPYPPLKRGEHGEFVRIEVFNIRGQRVKTLLDGSLEFGAGIHSVEWDGRDDGGRTVSSGVYFYRMTAGEFSETRRMLLMK